MRFASVAVDEAEGAVLAHGVRLPGRTLRKGRVLSREDVVMLAAAEQAAVTVATIETGDVGEDEAAARIAVAVYGPGLTAAEAFTGRANATADADGVLVVDAARVDALNRVDEAITLATLPAWSVVRRGQMVATVKIIPFAVAGVALEAAVEVAGSSAIRLAPFVPRRIRLIQTELPSLAAKALDKTARITADRVAAIGSRLLGEQRCAHRQEALEAVLRAMPDDWDILLIVGASAITDRRDVIPVAVAAAGGELRHLGMPVDPGNLLLLASLDGRPVLGLPGCARSPAHNGFDWVLQRLAAGIAVDGADIQAMGVGGLLVEMPARPQPREAPRGGSTRLAAVVLAAGLSRRMGERNKLLIEVDGTAMVRRTVEAVREAGIERVVVVTGHQAAEVEEALAGLDVRFTVNADYADGLSGSLQAGIAALPDDVAGAVVCLGDMPRVESGHLHRLIATFDAERGIVVPTHRGRRGNPVIWERSLFDEMRGLGGDVGAKLLMMRHPERVTEVEMEDDAVLIDVDTPQALELLGGGAG